MLHCRACGCLGQAEAPRMQDLLVLKLQARVLRSKFSQSLQMLLLELRMQALAVSPDPQDPRSAGHQLHPDAGSEVQ